MTPAPEKDNPLVRLTAVTSRRPLPLALTALVLAALALLLLLPIGLVVATGFLRDGRLSLYWFGRIASNNVLTSELLNSVALACVTTLGTLLIALPLAAVRARCRFRGQAALGVLLLVPMILPPFVGALSMRHLFSQFGVFNLLLERIGLLDFAQSRPPDWLGGGFYAVAVLQVLHLFPIMYLNATAALANVDPAYSQAARNLGAGPIRTFFRITLPLMRPGLFAGGTIIFIWSMTDIGTPLILGYEHLTPVTIFRELAKDSINPRTYSLVFIMLSGSITLYVLGKFLFGRAPAAESSKATVSAELRPLGAAGTLGAWALFGGVIFAALLPHAGVVLTAVSGRWVNTILPTEYTLRHLRFVITQPDTYNSILNSLQYASIATAIDLVVGGMAAWLIVRSRVFGRTLLDGLTMLPLAVPGLIMAAGYVALTAAGPLKPFGPLGTYPMVILIAAYSIRRLPLVVRGVSAGLQQVPESLEEAARNLGASRMTAALRITLPLFAAILIAAGVLTFAFAVLEVSDSLILAQLSKHYPITKQLYILASTGTEDSANVASALGVYGMAFLGGTLAIAAALLGKRLGAIFRA